MASAWLLKIEIIIFELCKTRRKDAGINTYDNNKIIHSGGDNHQRGLVIVVDLERSTTMKGNWAVFDRI